MRCPTSGFSQQERSFLLHSGETLSEFSELVERQSYYMVGSPINHLRATIRTFLKEKLFDQLLKKQLRLVFIQFERTFLLHS
jgi:hypothetical protein